MNALLSLGGWSVIPDLATRYTLQLIYSTPLIHRTLRLKPSPPNTPAYRRHYGLTFAVVVLGYLLYTLVEKAVNAPENFYETLGVEPGVDEGGLRVAFRQFAKRYHPDRVGKGGEERFMLVRTLVEALKNPAVRFAYDRFGPDVLKWKGRCSTTGDYLWHGLMQSAGYHIASLAFLLFWSAVGRSTPFTFWRYILYFTLLTLELRLILSPSPSPSGRHITLLHRLFPNRVIYQHILFLHQVFMFLNVALMRVTPHLIEQDELDDPYVEAKLVERTMALVSLADRETSKMVHTELQSISHLPSSPPPHLDTVGFASSPHHPSFARMEPVSPETAAELLNGDLGSEIETLIIENNLKQGKGPLKTAWEAAVRRVWGRRVEEVEAEERARREREQGAEEGGRLRETGAPIAAAHVSLNPLTPSSSMSSVDTETDGPVAVKLEEGEEHICLSSSPPTNSSPRKSGSPRKRTSPLLGLPSTPTHNPSAVTSQESGRASFRSSRFNSIASVTSSVSVSTPGRKTTPPVPFTNATNTVTPPALLGANTTTPPPPFPPPRHAYDQNVNNKIGIKSESDAGSQPGLWDRPIAQRSLVFVEKRLKVNGSVRTPGELPSPTPSPQPQPPSPFPRVDGRGGGGGGGGYFVKGAGWAEDEEGPGGGGEKVRARSLSC